jgi:DNA-binding NtrC family response regulator
MKVARNKVLLIDDEAGVRFGIRDFLEQHGYEVAEADNCQRAPEIFRAFHPDVVLLDYLLGDGNALQLLPRLKEIDPSIPMIILTANGSIDLAVRAIKEGAEHFLTKPVELPALLVLLERVTEQQRHRQKHLIDKAQQRRHTLDPFIGTSAAIRQLRDQAVKVILTESPVLILGETGTGKGVLATWLHNNGPRAEEAFVDLNCAGLSRELLETELFGHEKGAFTGATSNKVGLLEVAHRGTVFLDEIGDVDPQIQPKLLKVLEEKRFRRLGEVKDRQVDIRLIAATCQDLGQLSREKRFRSDLYFRISTIPLTIPPLRNRVEDIPLLARHILSTLTGDGRRAEVRPDAERRLKEYLWPGNIRELRNVLERAVLLSGSNVIGSDDLYFDKLLANETEFSKSNLTLLDLEKQHIQKVILEENGRIDEAAKRLGIPRSSLYQKIKKFKTSTDGL